MESDGSLANAVPIDKVAARIKAMRFIFRVSLPGKYNEVTRITEIVTLLFIKYYPGCGLKRAIFDF
jgi:hypothetical protein